MTRNERKLSKEHKLHVILLVILCILTIAVIAVYTAKKSQERYEHSYAVGAVYGTLTGFVNRNCSEGLIESSDYKHFHEASLRMLAEYSQENANEVQEAAKKILGDSLASIGVMEVNDMTAFRDGYNVFSSISLINISMASGEITEDEYYLLQEAMDDAINNPTHANSKAFIDKVNEIILYSDGRYVTAWTFYGKERLKAAPFL